MSACRVRGFVKGLGWAVIGGAAALPAWAQAPVRLVPLEPPVLETAPTPAPAPESYLPENGPRTIEGIEVRPLREPNFESVGVLDQRRGGFGPTTWMGTPAVAVRSLMSMMPGASDSHVLNALSRRLLLSAATAPEGAADRQTGAPTLVELRAERLMKLGDVDGVVALSKAAPSAAGGALLTRLEIDALLVMGQAEEACAKAQTALSSAGDDYLAQVQVFCTFSGGDVLAGTMGLDLLRERKQADKAFVAAAEVLGGLPPVPADKLTLAEPQALHVAAFAAARQPLPEFEPKIVAPAVLRAIATNGALPTDQRLAAAETAEALGAVEAEFVRRLYGEIAFTPEELSTAIPSAEAGNADGRALLYRAALDMPDPGVRAQLIARALDLAADKGQFASAARLFQPLIAEIRPDATQADFAATAARAFYALGRPEAAAKWHDLAHSGSDPRAGDRLWPFAALSAAGGHQPLSTPAYAAWRATMEGLAPELMARRSAILLGALTSLGARVPDAAWADTLALPAANGPPFGPLAMMRGGAVEARPGITVLATLAAIGEGKLSEADPQALSEAIRALALVGLAAEARALAVEALIANGI